jgi:hypothetical protein
VPHELRLCNASAGSYALKVGTYKTPLLLSALESTQRVCEMSEQNVCCHNIVLAGASL